jgi:class 3 adenylate cyclase/tetratricopeptide (TPR) repeat protein
MEDSVSCVECQATNPAGAAFCMKCGAALSRSCPSCGVGAAPGARFCHACGSPLGEQRGAAGAAEDVAESEERRTVTILFADLSGYTSVAERLDHETVKTVIERCLTRFAAEVERFGGRVDKYIGDNVMAVFGAPVAHEDDAERALRAAFGMQSAMAELNRDLVPEFGLELALCVGVNTGEVLAGRIGDAYTVTGDAVNVAARLQAAAPAGGILVGERTQRLSAGGVAYRELEPLTLRGKAEPVSTWEALEVREAGRSATGDAPSTPLVGRGEEISRLESLFERVVRDGTPHLVTVIGQAGVGKSRLLRELEGHLEQSAPPVSVRRGRCLAVGSGIVYWPLAEILRAECGIGEGDDGELVRAKLTERLGPLLATLEGADLLARRIVPLARMLGAGGPADELLIEQEDQQSAREGLFGAVRAVFEALAQDEVLVLAWEDLHWADEGTLDLIDYLSRWLRAPVLQLCLARDELLERRPDWSALRRTVTAVFLEPLAPGDARELIEALLYSAGAEVDLPGALAERSGGNPLFAEAMVRRIAEDGDTTAEEMPDTVQGLLAARLDSLEPFERQLVAHAAVIGRTFWESALEPIAVAAGEQLGVALATLREKDILVPGEGSGLAGERELAFKHVLIRDVAYEMLPKAVRARKHADIGAFIEGRAGGRVDGTVALVAEHYGRAATFAAEAHLPAAQVAEMRAQALVFGEAAGDAAAALYSNREALAHYEAAAALTDANDGTAQRIAEKRADVSLRLGQVEPAIESWLRCLDYYSEQGDLQHVAELHRKVGAALAHKGERKAAIEHHQQGINLIKDSGPSLALVRLYEEAAWLYMQVGDNMLAIYASEKALRLAESLGEAGAASRAHGIFGRVFGRIGDGVKARENLDRAVELARESDAGETVLALLALGHNLEHAEGDYGAAGKRYGEALALAERIGDVPAQIELYSALAQLAFYRCDWAEVERTTGAGAELAEREGLVGKLCLSNNLRGRLCWRDGDWEASARLFITANELAEQVGWSEVALSALSGLALTLRDRGDLAGAETALTDALAVCERAGLVPQSVEVYAALALTRALAGAPDLANEASMRAIEISQRVHDPAGEAAALEAEGIVGELPRALEALRSAGASWERLGRPLDVARCELLTGRRLVEAESDEAADVLGRAADLYGKLGVEHLAVLSRQLRPV